MWRKYGDDLYALLVLLVFSVEAVTLGALTWAFVLKLADQLDSGRVGSLLAGSVAVTAIALLVIGAHVLGYHALSSRRDRWRRERLDAWTERWVSVLFQAETPPTGPLSPEAEEALLDLRETLVGTEGERVEWLVRRYGLGEDLLYRSRAASRKRVLRPLAGLRRRRLSSRLEALESLAKARLASAIDPLIALVDDREPAVRIMALRTLSRTLARLPEGSARDGAADRFADLISVAHLPAGVIEESLLLLEGTAPRALERLLASATADGKEPFEGEIRLPGARLARVLDAVGRLKVLGLADEVGPFAGHPNPEVRAAALRALGALGILPAGAEQAAAAALIDPVEFVRIQATRTVALLPRTAARQALWDLLGDESWWVRRAAARALVHLGTDGPLMLERAGRSHPDRYARHMAVQVLLDAGRLDAARARHIREVG
jgi:HEAT repeat protein